MAAAETVTTETTASDVRAAASPARSVDQVTRTPDSPLSGTAPRAFVRQALDYELLTPPNYENIVGGAPPSPIASVLFLIGSILILVGAAVGLSGADTWEWWASGAVLAGIGLFLAAFVSRR